MDEELEEGLLNPETRNVQQVTVENPTEAYKLLEILMGEAVAPRRDYVLKHAEEAQV